MEWSKYYGGGLQSNITIAVEPFHSTRRTTSSWWRKFTALPRELLEQCHLNFDMEKFEFSCWWPPESDVKILKNLKVDPLSNYCLSIHFSVEQSAGTDSFQQSVVSVSCRSLGISGNVSSSGILISMSRDNELMTGCNQIKRISFCFLLFLRHKIEKSEQDRIKKLIFVT